jgi:hypothetical protein
MNPKMVLIGVMVVISAVFLVAGLFETFSLIWAVVTGDVQAVEEWGVGKIAETASEITNAILLGIARAIYAIIRPIVLLVVGILAGFAVIFGGKK